MPDNEKLEELRSRLSPGLQRELLDGAGLVLAQTNNPVRAHLFAAGLRELFGLTLETLAPDDSVTKCDWYEPVPNTSGPTRRQRALYATRGGLSDEFIREKLDIDLDELHTGIGKAFLDLNKRTHVRLDTHLSKPDEIEAFANEQVAALLDIFQTMDELRARLTDAIEESLHDEAVESMINETILSLDEISAKYAIEGVWVSGTEVTSIDTEFVRYEMEGSVDVQLNWGDRRDGASIDKSFPFKCEAAASVEDPTAFISDMTSVSIDTRGWYGNDVEE